ncbi:MAG: hypothetical protein PF569_03780 [Candidatus Woesearchaeota archaeon]|nr:hypothetical protein [Candidatus Woesearchaeota archaeon]
MAKRDAISINERQLLKTYFENPDLISENNQFFLTPQGDQLYSSLLKIVKYGEDCNIDSWRKYTADDNNVPMSLYDDILDTNIKVESFPQYLKRQREDFYVNQFENSFSEKLMDQINRKNRNLDTLKEIIQEGEELLSNIEGDSHNVKTYGEIIKDHKKTLEERNSSEDYLTSGDSHLDSVLSYPMSKGEITIIGASSGIGKTTYTRYLINKRIVKRLPTMYFSLEMSEEAFADPSISAIGKIKDAELKGLDIEDDMEEKIPSSTFDKLDKLYNKYKDHDTFYFCDESVLSITDLKILIKKYLKKMPKTMVNPVIFVDLMSMLSDFNNSKGNLASVYELAMNKLHSEIAKDLNVHVVGIFQLRRPSDKVKIESYEEIFDKLKPSPETIKNSGAIYERARQILLLFRPKHYGIMYLGADDPEVRVADDVMYTYVMKQNRGKLGKVMYLCDFDKNTLFPYRDDEQIDLGD